MSDNGTHPTPSPVDPCMTLREVVRAYRRPSYWTWLHLVHRGDLPAIRLPLGTGAKRRILVRRSDVEAVLARYREVGHE